jgi:hypothetical protein
VGNDALRVLVYIQKARIMRGTEAHASQFMLLNCGKSECYFPGETCVASMSYRSSGLEGGLFRVGY